MSDENETTLMVSDDARNQIAHIFHQRELGFLLVEASSEWMWCLMPGQWPDLPPQEASELGNVVELVQTISLLFQLVMQERVLSSFGRMLAT